jgi:hypothetical protein
MGSKYVQELTGFYNDLNSTLSTIAGIQKSAADAAKRSADAAKRHADAVKRAAARALAARQRTAEAVARDYLGHVGPLGFRLTTQFALSPELQLADARAQALGDTSQIQSVARRMRRAAYRALGSGRLAWEAQIQAWQIIGQANSALAQQAIGGATRFQHVSRAVITVGASSDAYAGAYRPRTVVINGGVHLHGVHDVAALENALEARAKRRPQPRRGR